MTEDQVMHEVKTLQYFYGLKYEIRYGLKRDAKDYTESVAEHIYGMHVLADYFQKYEDPQNQLDKTTIHTMITWHEVGELETGDIISWKKTAADAAREEQASMRVLERLPEAIRESVSKHVIDYEQQASPEAKFVKAIDKVEPLFHLYNDLGKAWANHVNLTLQDSVRIKEQYIAPYPTIKLFTDTLHGRMEKEGFFSS
jgi:5'-deoxynucleotidase YfbR-like HD superfamily hydrolase